MKKRNLLFIIAITVFALQIETTFAHSGRTDANGGHNCSEKSKTKGLCTGYHYHNGGGSTSTSGESNTSSKPASKPQVDYKKIEAEQNYQDAKAAFDNENYELAVSKLNNIYNIGKATEETKSLLDKTSGKLLENSEQSLKNKEYEKAAKAVSLLKDNKNVSEDINKKANEIHKQVISIENKAREDYQKAVNALNSKTYADVFQYLDEVNKAGKSDENTKQLREQTIDQIYKEANEYFAAGDYKSTTEYYAFLEKEKSLSEEQRNQINTNLETIKIKELDGLLNEAKENYEKEEYQKSLELFHSVLKEGSQKQIEQATTDIQKIEKEQKIKESFGITMFNKNKNHLFNKINSEQPKHNKKQLIDAIKETLKEKDNEDYKYLKDINIKLFFEDGEQNAN